MRLIPRSLFGRNLMLLAGMIIVGQLTAGALFYLLAQKPRVTETAEMAAGTLVAVRDGLQALPVPAREAFVHRFNSANRPDPAFPAADDRQLLPSERQLLRAISTELANHDIDTVWRHEHGGLFVRLRLDARDYWLAAGSPGLSARPRVSTLASWIAAGLIALMGAWLIQRRLNRPLDLLASAARRIEAGQNPVPLPEDGPSEIAALASAFNRMQTALAERERSRALMLAGISHDLRTPLSKMRLSVELLRDAPDVPPDPTLLDGMAGSCRRMDDIIGQFIDFARLNDDTPLTPVDVGASIRQAASTCPGGDSVALDVPEGLVARSHAPALTRMITNLLDNAIKHGAPPVRLYARGSESAVRITLEDAGPGLSESDLARLRQPFTRGNPARGGPPGSGLGLAIADHIAARLGIELSFSHPPGGGWRVDIKLPAAN